MDIHRDRDWGDKDKDTREQEMAETQRLKRRKQHGERETGTRRTTEVKKKYELCMPRFGGGTLLLEREEVEGGACAWAGG